MRWAGFGRVTLWREGVRDLEGPSVGQFHVSKNTKEKASRVPWAEYLFSFGRFSSSQFGRATKGVAVEGGEALGDGFSLARRGKVDVVDV